jgi:hypothetical protein
MEKLITRAELEKLYTENGPDRAMEALGCSRPTLYKLLKRADIPLKSPRKKPDSPEYRFKIVEG